MHGGKLWVAILARRKRRAPPDPNGALVSEDFLLRSSLAENGERHGSLTAMITISNHRAVASSTLIQTLRDQST